MLMLGLGPNPLRERARLGEPGLGLDLVERLIRGERIRRAGDLRGRRPAPVARPFGPGLESRVMVLDNLLAWRLGLGDGKHRVLGLTGSGIRARGLGLDVP